MGAQGTTTVSFGSSYADIATVAVTGQTGILTSSLCEAWLDPTQPDTADHSSDEHVVAEIDVRCQAIVGGTGFTIVARARGPFVYAGAFNVSWVWS